MSLDPKFIDLMKEMSTGIQSGKEEKLIDESEADLKHRLSSEFPASAFKIVGYTHKPFDSRYFAYFEDPAPFMNGIKLPKSYRARQAVSKHMLKENVALLMGRSNKSQTIDHYFISDHMIDVKCAERTTGSVFAPLYLYPAEDELDQTRKVNFDPKLYAKIRTLATHPDHGEPDEVAVFDYIYGVLHSPDYRETFAEFLKIDFPRIPWPASPDVFWHVREKGEALRRLHLMEEAAVGAAPYRFEGQGDNAVEKGFPKFEATKDGLGEVWINKDQRFADVPEVSWGFYIGGYQPAQKWLKDRRGRTLSFDDIRHYQKIIKILSETDRIMKEIDLPLDLEAADAEGEA